jgi:hypothetical protein
MAEEMFGNLVKNELSTDKLWRNYFYSFNYAARLNKFRLKKR